MTSKMRLFRQLLFLILVCFVQRGSSIIARLKVRYVNLEGVEVRLPVSPYLVEDSIRLMLGAEVASTIVLPEAPVVALTYGNLVDTSLLLSLHVPENSTFRYNGFLRISLPNLRFQGDEKLFSLPIHEFFLTPEGQFYDPFFNEEVRTIPLDSSYYIGAFVNMTFQGEFFTINGAKNLKCVTKEGDKEDLKEFMQDELYISPTGKFAPKVCEVPEFCDSLGKFFDLDLNQNLFVTKREGRTRKLCKGYVIFKFSELFSHYTLLESTYLEGFATALHMQTSIWIGLKYRD